MERGVTTSREGALYGSGGIEKTITVVDTESYLRVKIWFQAEARMEKKS